MSNLICDWCRIPAHVRPITDTQYRIDAFLLVMIAFFTEGNGQDRDELDYSRLETQQAELKRKVCG